MTSIEQTIWCDGCGVEIDWGPLAVGNRRYCCRVCYEGSPCQCGERMELDDEQRGRVWSPSGLAGGDLA